MQRRLAKKMRECLITFWSTKNVNDFIKNDIQKSNQKKNTFIFMLNIDENI